MRKKKPKESPKLIYAAACEQIAMTFVRDGFTFAKSGPHFSKRSGDFVFSVTFQSSHNNEAGKYVALWIHAIVRSARLKKWRIANGSLIGPYDFVAGGQIGNLSENQKWLEWDLAKPATRKKEIKKAAAAIRKIALPYFARFDDVPELCRHLETEDIPSMHPLSAFDVLACFDSLESARKMAVRYLAQNPQLLKTYRENLREFGQNGLHDTVPSGYAESLAALSHMFNLGDLSRA